jgi:methionine synthase II (cobalamin-independent)
MLSPPTLVGSYPQPDWLDRRELAGRFPPLEPFEPLRDGVDGADFVQIDEPRMQARPE